MLRDVWRDQPVSRERERSRQGEEKMKSSELNMKHMELAQKEITSAISRGDAAPAEILRASQSTDQKKLQLWTI